MRYYMKLASTHIKISNVTCMHSYRKQNACTVIRHWIHTVIEHQMHAQLSNTKLMHAQLLNIECTHSMHSYWTSNARTAIKHQSKREMPCTMHLSMFDKMLVHTALLHLRMRKRVMCHVPLLSTVESQAAGGVAMVARSQEVRDEVSREG